MDADCTTEIAHSTCADGICSCADGYTQQNDECEETKTKDPGNMLYLYIHFTATSFNHDTC